MRSWSRGRSLHGEAPRTVKHCLDGVWRFAGWLATGLRVSETVDLALGDLHLVNRIALVRHGKGDKARAVRFDITTAAALDRTSESVPAMPTPPSRGSGSASEAR